MNSKKKKIFEIIIALIAIIIVIILLLRSCATKQYTIKFDTAGAGNIVDIKVDENGKAIKPKDPIRKGYVFAGWYVNDEEFDFNTPILDDMELEAHWSKAVYIVTVKLNNGETINEEVEYEDTLSLNTPTRTGYKFLGWYVNDEEFDINTKITEDMVVEAKWEKIKTNLNTSPKANQVKYTVEHYLMNISGKYSDVPYIIQELTGYANKEVEVKTKEFIGFTVPETKKVTIKADGTTVVQYFYDRNKYEIKVGGDNGISKLKGAGSYFYEQEVDIEAILNEGYSFVSWSNGDTNLVTTYKINAEKSQEIKATTIANTYKLNIDYDGGIVSTENKNTYNIEEDFTLNTPIKQGYVFDYWLINGTEQSDGHIVNRYGDLDIKAVYKEADDTPYQVEHYFMNLNGNYEDVTAKYIDENLVGTTNHIPEYALKTDEGFIFDEEETGNIPDIKADGTTIVKLYYKRLQYNLTLEKDEHIESVVGEGLYYYGQEIQITATAKEGYSFDKWSNDVTDNPYIYTVTADENQVLKAISKPNIDTKYVVKHVLMDVKGKYDDSNPYKTENLIGETDSYVTPQVLSSLNKEVGDIEGFIIPSEQQIKIKPDGTTELIYHYERKQYVFSINYDEGIKGIIVTSPRFSDGIDYLEKYADDSEFLVYYQEPINVVVVLNDGYEFLGWSDDNQELTRDFKPTQEISIELKTTLKTYEVTFNTMGGKIDSNKVSIKHGSTISSKNATRSGYIFKGWYLTEECANGTDKNCTQFDFNTPVTSDFTLYAKWELEEETLIFETNGGTEIDPIKIKYNELINISSINNPTKKGYTFDGWYNEKDFKTKFENNKVTMPLEGKTIYAKWNAINYTITYKDVDANQKTSYTIEDVIELTTPRKNSEYKDAYVFSHWSLTSDEDAISDIENLENNTIPKGTYGNLTLTAHYTPNEYNITYKLDDSTSKFVSEFTTSNRNEYNIEDTLGDGITFTYPNIEGYKFKEWQKDGVKLNDNKIPENTYGELTLTAVYEPIQYKVKYDGNGKTNVTTMEDSIFTYNVEGTLKESTFERKGYTFLGWSKEKTAETPTYTSENNKVLNLCNTDNCEVTLYAIWQANKYRVVFDGNGNDGGAMGPQEFTFDDIEKALSDNQFTKTGYHFVGWSLTKETQTKKYDNKAHVKNLIDTPNGEYKLYAMWELNKISVTYHEEKNSGKIVTEDFTYGQNKWADNEFSKHYTITYNYNYEVEPKTETEIVNVSQLLDTEENKCFTKLNEGSCYTISNLNEYLKTNNGGSLDLYVKWEEKTKKELKEPTRDKYVFDSWSTDGTDSSKVSSPYDLTNDIELKALWDEIPYVESLSFKVRESDGNERMVDAVIGDNGFYIKLPTSGTINPAELIIKTTIPVTLNSQSYKNQDNKYSQVYSNGENKVTLSGNSITLTSSDGKVWTAKSSSCALGDCWTDMKLFTYAIQGSPLGVVKGLVLNDKAESPKYISTNDYIDKSVNGSYYVFFKIEGTEDINVNFKKNDGTIVQTLKIPKGSPVPNIGTYIYKGEKTTNWYTDSAHSSTFDFNKRLYTDTDIYGDFKIDSGNTTWYTEHKTDSSYCLNNFEDLKGFGYLVNQKTETFANKIVYICSDIETNGEDFLPIIGSNFKGTLDGKYNETYHKIKNLTITNSSQENNVDYAGLFTKLNGATVQNIIFEDVVFNTSNKQLSGVIAGEASGKTLISNILINGIKMNSVEQMGGFVGHAQGNSTQANALTISNSAVIKKSDDDHISGSNDIGSFVGYANSGYIILKNLYSDVDVTGTQGMAPDTGGILGDYDSSNNYLEMKNVVYTGKVTGAVGSYNSFLGDMLNYASGPIYGRIGSGGKNNNKYDTDMSDNKSTWLYDSNKIGLTGHLDRGTGKTTSELTSANETIFPTDKWDRSIWTISNGKYPMLKWINDLGINTLNISLNIKQQLFSIKDNNEPIIEEQKLSTDFKEDIVQLSESSEVADQIQYTEEDLINDIIDNNDNDVIFNETENSEIITEDEDEEEKKNEITSYPIEDEIIQDEDYSENTIEPEEINQ